MCPWAAIVLQEVRDPERAEDEVDPERDALGDASQSFWKEFLAGRERVNSFVNVLRPRARSAAADYEKRGAA